MKKFLLSILLALLCQVTAKAQPPCHNPNPHNRCLKTINGVQYLSFTVSCLEPGQTVAIWYQSTMGVSPGAAPCSTSLHPITGDLILYYCIDPAYPLLFDENGCVHFTWSQAWNGNFPTFPPGATFEDKICPCGVYQPCDARFSYCVMRNGSGNWVVSLNLLATPPTSDVDFVVDGVVIYNPILSDPLIFAGGSHTICIRVWNGERYDYCEYCVNICLPGHGGPIQPKMAQVQGGQSETAFSEVKIYPNPASNSTKLEFSLQEDQQLTIELIDISGRVVSTVKNEKATAGYHAVDINTSDVPSGTYIVRMKTGNAVANYRLSVVK